MPQQSTKKLKSGITPASRPNSAGPLVTRKEKLAWAALLLLAYAVIATWGQFDFSDLMGLLQHAG